MKSKRIAAIAAIIAVIAILAIGSDHKAGAQTYYSFPTPSSLCDAETGTTGYIGRVNGQISNPSAYGVVVDCPLFSNSSTLNSVIVTGWNDQSNGVWVSLCSTQSGGSSTCGGVTYVSATGEFSIGVSDLSKWNSYQYNYLRIAMLAPSYGTNNINGYTELLSVQ